MDSSSSFVDPPLWDWPEDLPGSWTKEEQQQRPRPPQEHEPQQQQPEPSSPSSFSQSQTHPSPKEEHKHNHQEHNQDQTHQQHNQDQNQNQQRERFYRPRTCRICLETVLPTFRPASESLPGFLRPSPTVTYESEDGGRLLRPCLCKGSQKYVHEACLQAWRMQNPLAKRNYWQCPTCRYKYRLERMTWGRWISSTSSQIMLTIAIFLVAAFALGYVADPIINLYLDPYDTIAHGSQPLVPEDEPITWPAHFAKGLASLGLLGFAKFLLTLGPWQWYNMRTSGVLGGTRNTGRDRMAQLSWIAVSVGVLTFIWAVWKGVRAWSRRTLAAASERVMDVPGADFDEDD